MQDLISIIVPIYNVEKYLRQCIESILLQTYSNLEIILVDDGSEDGCSTICDEYAGRDSRIVVIHKANEGLVCGRKAGIKRATGKYVQCVDGDDWIEPQMTETLHELMACEDVDVAMCGHYEDYGDHRMPVKHGFEAGRYGSEELKSVVFPHMICGEHFFQWGLFPSMWDKMYKREMLMHYQFGVDESITMGEDAACNYPLLSNANSIYISDEILYHYRQRNDSMILTQEYDGMIGRRFETLYASVLHELENTDSEYGLCEQWKKYVLFLVIPRMGFIQGKTKEMNALFPYKDVNRGDEIIIYGMGVYGTNLYRYLTESGFCKVALCVDRDYEKLQNRGIEIVSPDEIGNCDCQKIVIANSFGATRDAIARDLKDSFPGKMILNMDMEMVENADIIRMLND